MNRHRMIFLMSVIALSLPAHGSAVAPRLEGTGQVEALQQPSDTEWCRDQHWGDDREAFCEVREYTLPPGGTVTVDASPNGGIEVQGAPRGDVLVQARVVATAGNEARAREIASGVQVDATSAQVSATGPRGLNRGEGWHVSYRIAVPTQTALSLRSNNGGISVANVEGRIDFQTVNGGVKLTDLAGEVTGRTTNGGLKVDLDGPTWTGAGLDVETNNGGVHLEIPEQYSARLEASTHNGGMNIDFPITVQGGMSRQISANLGAGGPLIRVRTHNGGIRVTKK